MAEKMASVRASASRLHVLRRPRTPVEGLFCNYSHRVCMQSRLSGFEYCLKHILEDKNAPYKQCNYMSNRSGKRCLSAAPKDKKEGYCQEHARRTAYLRRRASRKKRPKETPETLLAELEHYAPRKAPAGFPEGTRRTRILDSMMSRIMEYASSSESDSEAQLVDQAWMVDGDSDAESVDSEQEDPLKHAGIYTAEEVALITRDKLIRLQSLYIDQFKRLQHIMKEKRRKYLHSAKSEKDAHGSVHALKDDPEQHQDYERLMAMKRYHKRHGKEALLHRQSKERRVAVSEGASYKPPSFPKCIHVKDNNQKCGARTIPLSKYCFKHIQGDPHQVLFQRCKFASSACARPTVPFYGSLNCLMHSKSEPIFHRLPGKEEPTEAEDVKEEPHIDVVGNQDPVEESTMLQVCELPPVGQQEATPTEPPAVKGHNVEDMSQQSTEQIAGPVLMQTDVNQSEVTTTTEATSPGETPLDVSR